MARVARDIAENRPFEIVDACRRLYRKASFHEIGFQEISREANLSRPAIYNYFQTKEEVFLALLKDEYRLWANSLEKVIEKNETLNEEKFAEEIALTLKNRETLLKIQCMNLYDIEENSREEKLDEFKIQYGRAMDFIEKALMKFFSPLTEEDRNVFILEFFPFMYGVFPYVHPTEKQKKSMKKAGMKERKTSTYEITRQCILDLLRSRLNGK